MNNKGFIATALIYSFFLVFCAVLLIYTNTSIHNNNLINKSLDDARNNIGYKTLDGIKIGDYVNLNMTSTMYNINAVNWNVFKINTDKVYLISNSYILSIKNENSIEETVKKIESNLSNISNVCIIEALQPLEVNSDAEFNNIKNIDKDSHIKLDYFVIYQGNYKKYTYENNRLNNYSLNDDVAVRAVAVISKNNIILNGTGSLNQPYILVGC